MKLEAPWTDEEVAKLNFYQSLGYVHEYTCTNNHFGERRLLATKDGWLCKVCGYHQTWAHAESLRPPPDPLETLRKLDREK